MAESAGAARRPRGRPATGVREAILSAALEILSKDGLDQLTTRAVARRAHTSEASVFYHFGDKVGLLQEAVLAGLGPLKAVDPEALSGAIERRPADTLGVITAALLGFFDHAMPVMAAIQADAGLRMAFAERLVAGDLGPHRGVRLIADYLRAMAAQGAIRADVDYDAIAMMVVSSCFLAAWQRAMAGENSAVALPEVSRVVETIARLLAPERVA
ncbi:MAG: helix-turn-helix domain-containing protein [Candidatus Dormiibacterota bacterium]